MEPFGCPLDGLLCTVRGGASATGDTSGAAGSIRSSSTRLTYYLLTLAFRLGLFTVGVGVMTA